jgi:SnoaL-like domain
VVLGACDQIRNLIHRYSEAVDQGRFEVLDELFADATVRTAMGSGSPGAGLGGALVAAMFRDRIILYADGTPRTRHLVTNTIIEVDEAAGRATARSYNTTLQQVPGRSIEIIATARYEDSFALVDGAWRFSERVIRHASLDGVHRDFIGDMSRHVRNAPLSASASGPGVLARDARRADMGRR